MKQSEIEETKEYLFDAWGEVALDSVWDDMEEEWLIEIHNSLPFAVWKFKKELIKLFTPVVEWIAKKLERR